MFKITKEYEMPIAYELACRVVKSRGRGDLLEGMYAIDSSWADFMLAGKDDDDFFDEWAYEANAYNVVYEKLQNPL